jgi:8-oxo-dGTP pyrophosphatase MutT (NUDIX family)
MSNWDDRLSGLSSVLFPPSTPLAHLPISGYRSDDPNWQPRLSAVLLPLVLAPQPALVLTVRSDGMSRHAGQVALPGGCPENAEPFPVQTALREADEETGIKPGCVEVLGLMQQFDTISAYRIIPVVGLIRQEQILRRCPQEVYKIFTVPLERVVDADSYCRHQVRHLRKEYEVWSMRSDCWPVWGATAAILADFAHLASSNG